MADKPYLAKVKLCLNQGRLTVLPGQVVYLGDEDDDVNIPSLLKLGAIVEVKRERKVKKSTEVSDG